MAGKKGKPALNNPHGANQYQLDPRQTLFLAYYLDPKSQSFGKSKESAVLAGYEETYAEQVLSRMPTWLLNKVQDYQGSRLLEKAERNLEEMLDLPSKTQAMGAFGPLYEKVGTGKKKKVKGKMVEVVKKRAVMTYAPGLLKIKNDASQFIAERVGRKRYGKEAEDPNTRRPSILYMTQININPPAQPS